MNRKRTLALLLAAWMSLVALTSCQTEEAKETSTEPTSNPVSETAAPATDYAAHLITENGTAKAHIVLAEGAAQLEQYAAEELAYHIKKVSGAEISVVSAAEASSLPIFIGTPDSIPELETLFPEDLAWLRDLGEEGTKTRWGSDGFAIRQLDKKLYIFGVTPRGALNGVYDFIEDNMGVLWTRADEEIGLIYDEIPTITVQKADYREKSPFELRGWCLSANDETKILLSRNKLNTLQTGVTHDPAYYEAYTKFGFEPYMGSHNITWWITNSPSYDPNNTEYWATPKDGASTDKEAFRQINFWGDAAVQCVADHVLAHLDACKETCNIRYLGLNLEDWVSAVTFEEMSLSYEYAPGQFIEPGASNYFSTVFFSFMNKIARIVGEKYPDVILHTYAYGSFNSSSYWTTVPTPACELEPNLHATFAPVDEDLCAPLGESQNHDANMSYDYLLQWMERTTNIQVYNYYGCYTGFFFYERPIWDRIQSDLQLYAANGLHGLVPEGSGDGADTHNYMETPNYKITSELRAPYLISVNNWNMNDMTYWLYSKLAWNPDEDVDALISYYCDKVWGKASEYMQEYYRLMEFSWTMGNEYLHDEFNGWYLWRTIPMTYWDFFFDMDTEDGVLLPDAIAEILRKAYDAAENDRQRNAIAYRLEIYENAEALLTDETTPMTGNEEQRNGF